MNRKEGASLVVNQTQQKFAKSHKRVPHTFREDQSLRYGDSVMLKSCRTNGWLVCDMSDRISSNDEAYAVTTTDKAVGACARSIVCLVRGGADGAANDDIIRYGQEIRIKSNDFISNKDLFLSS